MLKCASKDLTMPALPGSQLAMHPMYPSIGVLGVPCDVTINRPSIVAYTRSSSPTVEEIFFLGSFLPGISIVTSCTQIDNKHCM
jgi:hypothetical protein